MISVSSLRPICASAALVAVALLVGCAAVEQPNKAGYCYFKTNRAQQQLYAASYASCTASDPKNMDVAASCCNTNNGTWTEGVMTDSHTAPVQGHAMSAPKHDV